MQNSTDSPVSMDTGYDTYSRTEGIDNQTPPRFEGSNLPVGNFPKEMLNHKKPMLKNNKSSKSLINQYGNIPLWFLNCK